MGRVLVAALVLCGCKANLGADGDSDAGAADASPLVAVDAAPDIDANIPLGAWGAPQLVPGAGDATNGEDDCVMNASATELIYAVDVPGSGTAKDLFVMTRADAASVWGAPQALTVLNSAGAEETPRLSADDLTLYFGQQGDIMSATRSAVGQPWTAPTPVTAANTLEYEKWFAVCGGGRAMVARDNDIYEGTIADGAMTLVPELSSTSPEISIFLSSDCLQVHFASSRGGDMQVYTSSRSAVDSPWSAPVLVSDVPFTVGTNEDAWFSPDGRTVVFASIRDGATTKDLYISTR